MNNDTPMNKNKFQLGTPCQLKFENLEKMDSSCRFCSICDKKVYDFTNCTEDEILAIFIQNNNKVCARIKKDAPVPPKTHFITQKSSFNIPTWFLAILAIMGISFSSCESEDKRNVSHTWGPDEDYGELMGDIEAIPINDTLEL